MREQPTFYFHRRSGLLPHESAYPALCHDPMAWHDDRDRVAATRATDGARGTMQSSRELTVASHLSNRNARQRLPHAALMRAAFQRERKMQRSARVGKIALKSTAYTPRERMRRRFEGNTSGKKTDIYQPPRLGSYADATERSGDDGVVRRGTACHQPQRDCADFIGALSMRA
jgi:hypothetical protein